MRTKYVTDLWNIAANTIIDSFNGDISDREFEESAEKFKSMISKEELMAMCKYEDKIKSLKEQLAEQIQYSAKLERALKWG